MYQSQGENLKMKLKSVTKLKLRKTREEVTLRNEERIVSEELRLNQIEIEILSFQLEALKQEVSRMNYQIAMIGICEASENTKVEYHIANIVHHQNDFNVLFSKETEAIEIHKLEIKNKEEAAKELEKQKEKIVKEKSQLLEGEAKTIEEECETIERECAVLEKRNKAIMLKLRRKLIESEDMRRAMIKDAKTPEFKRQ